MSIEEEIAALWTDNKGIDWIVKDYSTELLGKYDEKICQEIMFNLDDPKFIADFCDKGLMYEDLLIYSTEDVLRRKGMFDQSADKGERHEKN